MKVTEKEVNYVADLANLELTPAEHVRMVRDLNSILDYIDTLNQVDTTAVDPMAQVMASSGAAQDGTAVASGRRPDALLSSLAHDAALQNAPESDGQFFKVPKVIER